VPEGCHTCELVARRDRDEAPLWDRILRTPHFDVVHAYNTSLAGWIVVVLRRHLASVAGLSDAEAAELGPLLRDFSAALEEVTGCEKTYVMQFAEASGHHHVHWHVVPRSPEMPQEHRGAGVFHYLGVGQDSRVGEEAMNNVATDLRQWLAERDRRRGDE